MPLIIAESPEFLKLIFASLKTATRGSSLCGLQKKDLKMRTGSGKQDLGPKN